MAEAPQKKSDGTPRRLVCERCGVLFECLRNTECWCQQVAVPPPALSQLQLACGDCLCPDCLSAAARNPALP